MDNTIVKYQSNALGEYSYITIAGKLIQLSLGRDKKTVCCILTNETLIARMAHLVARSD